MKKKIIAFLIGIGMITGGFPGIQLQAADTTASLQLLKSGNTSQWKPTILNIQDMYNRITKATGIYTAQPSFKPYTLGTLDASFIASGLTSVNFVRYLAGVPQLSVHPTLNERAQYAAVLLARNNILTHTPERPGDMAEDFYEPGRDAAAASNLTKYEGNIAFTESDKLTRQVTATKDYMEDYYLYDLGHRFNLLNPPLRYTGFGFMEASDTSNFQTTYVGVEKTANEMDNKIDYNFIAWPTSGYMPADYFSNLEAWSLSLNPDVYGSTQNKNNITIKLTRLGSGESKTFTSSDLRTYTTSRQDANPYFLINANTTDADTSYGEGVEIIFYPGEEFFKDHVGENREPIFVSNNNITYAKSLTGVYEVEVRGIVDKQNNDASFRYQVAFFDSNGKVENLKLIDPASIPETYDPSVEEEIKDTTEGTTGQTSDQTTPPTTDTATTPSSGTTTDSTTTTPSSGTSTGGTTTTPSSGTSTGGTTTTPSSGTSTSGITTTPSSGATTGGTTTTPSSGTSTGGTTTTPSSGTITSGTTTTPSSSTTTGTTTITPSTSTTTTTKTPTIVVEEDDEEVVSTTTTTETPQEESKTQTSTATDTTTNNKRETTTTQETAKTEDVTPVTQVTQNQTTTQSNTASTAKTAAEQKVAQLSQNVSSFTQAVLQSTKNTTVTSTSLTTTTTTTVKTQVVSNMKVSVNGKSVNLTDKVLVESSRTLLPIRTIADALDLEIGYNAKSKVAILVKGDTTLEFILGSNLAIINGQKVVQIDDTNANVKIVSSNGRTYLPVRFIAEQLGLQVNYNNNLISLISTK